MRKLIVKFRNGLSGISQNIRNKNRFRILEKSYKKMAQKSGIDVSKTVTGEREYLSQWKTISKYVSPVDYRLYSQFIGQDKNIVPEYVMHNIIEPVFHPIEFLSFYNDKNMYDKLLPQEYLAKSLFRCIDGVFYGGGYDIVNQTDVSDVGSFCCNFDKVIVKPTMDTGNGSNILVYEKNGSKYLPINNDVPFSLASISSQYPNKNFVIQEYIKQSNFTAQFNPSSVNTFRIFTYKSVVDNTVKVLGIVFRIGGKNSAVDNCHAGGRYVGINPDGSFANNCVFDQYGNRFFVFNGIDFQNQQFVVPDFDKVIEFSRQIGERLCHMRTLDLDVMIDDKGQPRLIEFNVDMCSPWFYQFAVGPVFGEYTWEVINYIKQTQMR